MPSISPRGLVASLAAAVTLVAGVVIARNPLPDATATPATVQDPAQVGPVERPQFVAPADMAPGPVIVVPAPTYQTPAPQVSPSPPPVIQSTSS